MGMRPAKAGGYEELQIAIEGGKGGYHAQMRFRDEIDSAEFGVPMSPDRLEQTLGAIWLVSDQRPTRKGSLDGLDPVTEMGRALYAALFSGSLEAFLRRSQERASAVGAGLRLLVTVADEIAAGLPWEFLYDGRDFLALSTRSPVVRSLAEPQDPLPGPQGELRVLAAVADLGPNRGKLTANTRELYDGLQERHGPLKVSILEEATLGRLYEALGSAPYDLLHLCVFGKVPPGSQAIYLADEKGQPAPVPPDQLVRVLQPAKDLKLVCLDSEYSDMIAYDLARHTRVPAIYGIRSMVTFESAASFAHGFITSIVAGQTLTAASTTGRQEIDRARPGSREWGLPVLYTASPDGQLALSSWQTSYNVGSIAKGIETSPEEPARSTAPGRPSRERQKLETMLTMKRTNLQALEEQLAANSYPLPDVQDEAARLRQEIADGETRLAGMA